MENVLPGSFRNTDTGPCMYCQTHVDVFEMHACVCFNEIKFLANIIFCNS
jgi:hypothetical protein